MPGYGPKYYNCIVCNKRTKPKERRQINKAVKKYLEKKLFLIAREHDILCNRCKHKYYLAESCKPNAASSSDQTGNEINNPTFIPPLLHSSNPCASPPSVQLDIQSTPRTHSRCLICKKPGPKLVCIPSDTRFNAFIQSNVLISAGSRCCPSHFNDNDCNLKPESLSSVKVMDQTYLNRTSIYGLIQQLREMCLSKCSNINFDTVKDPDCKNLTGLYLEQFNDLYSFVSLKIKATPARTPKTSLGLFLLKMKSGLPNKLLSVLFRISRSSVRRAVLTVTKALMESFVPLFLGIESITREDIIEKHTRPLAKSIFEVGDNNIILVIDGTYIYIQKSSNFKCQRRSYSIHKGRPLVKPMIVVTTTGYFLSVFGPYLADNRNNDASILNHMLNKNVQDIKSFLREDDVLVVDRGFRDSLSMLEDLGIKSEMPSFTNGKQQMPTEDANSSRLVTKIRWVVESANSRIKAWKYLDHILPTNQIPFIGDYVRIVSALSNKYYPPLSCHKSVEEDMHLASNMKERSEEINSLQQYIEENGLDRKVSLWKPVDDCDISFPKYSEEELRSLTCGVYQIKMSTHYMKEHLDGDSDILVHKDHDNLIQAKIQSRHISAKQYKLWIKFTEAEVTSWFCKCRAGARVVGFCSHISSIIWYLSFARHQNNQTYGVKNWGQYLSDAADIPEDVDMSDNGSENSYNED